jgi:putative phosphoribosyl transferase
MLFTDRQDAGRRLANELLRFKDQRPAVLALPRGGVPVGFEIAAALEAPLDVVLVRKVGVPGWPELGLGAIVDGENPDQFIDQNMAATFDVSEAYLDREIARQRQEIERRREVYYKGRRPTDIRQRTVIVVDDGIATGATMRIALRALRRRDPARLVLAVPVAPADTLAALQSEADEIACLATPGLFGAISQFYADFEQVGDEKVIELLARAGQAEPGASAKPPPPSGQ